MDFNEFSLIYPTDALKKVRDGSATPPDIDLFTLQELGLLEVFNLKNSDLSEFITMDAETIRYRMATFDDMMNSPELTELLNKLVPILNDIMELRRLESDSGETDDYLSSITEIELYVSSVRVLHEGLSGVKARLKSPAFVALAQLVTDLAESDYYRELNQKLEELTRRVREIKSVTIGVNLDAQLRPSSAGVLSVNSESFKSGDVLDKILRMSFKNDEYTCIANLVPFGKKQSENQKMALSLAFNSAINDVYKASLRSWKKIVQTYVLENTDFLLGLVPEIEFLVKGTNLLRALQDKGCSLCTPEIATDRVEFRAIGLYNPCVALKIEDEIVTNDVIFDEMARIYVLTGPNRGGKSVVTCAVGLAQAMMQLGMFVPAEKATISPADSIMTHFPTGAEDTIEKGRLGEECARLGDIFARVSEKSLVLLDESLSSTGSYEASYIAAEVLRGLSMAGCRCIFSTHLHELAAELDNINAEAKASGGTPIDTLVAGIDQGQRSFKIYRAKPDGKSYARDIATKYGLTYENIIKTINR